MTHQPALSAPSRLAERRRAFRSGCAMAVALAFAGNAGTATAQSFQAPGEVVLGDAFITAEGSFTNVLVNAEQTVINWQLPSSTVAGNPPEVFQPVNTTADFQGGSGVNTFTVLNRILPFETVGGVPVAVNRAAQFNGTVTSPSSGSIWFYSPSGIVVGATAAFNVGNLVLTSNDIDTSGGLYGPGGEIRFRGAASSLAPVEIQAGAVINAAAGGDTYLAIVAPRIVQAGTIGADGEVTLIAAEQADITINAGMLDIVVTQGTTDPNGIVHTGSSGGAATFGTGVPVLSLLAIPKNTALTMLLSGSFGYTPATGAADEGGSVVLSAGLSGDLSNAQLAQNLGSIQIGNSLFTSPVTGYATNAIDIAPVGGTVEFQQGADLTAFQSLTAIAQDGESIISGQPLFLNSNQGRTGGTITIRAEGGATGGGEITATGGLFIEANGFVDILFPVFDQATPGTGGTVTLDASGGRIAADLIRLEASGNGQSGSDGNDLLGGDGTGGNITASVSDGGSITAPDFSAEASGFGSDGEQNGGDGFGGTVSLLNQGGTLDFGLVALSANGTGGASDAQAGDAQSGSVLIDIASGTNDWSDLNAEAITRGGQPFSFGSVSGSATGRPDAVSLHVGSGAVLNIAGNATLVAYAFVGPDGAGNAGTGGGASLLVNGGGTLRVNDTLTVGANAAASGESMSFSPLTSPTLTGGTVSILADGGTIDAHSLSATADAYGASATDSSGTVTGGTITVGATNGGTISTFAVGGVPGSFVAIARAYGASGPAPADAFGGTTTLYADGGTLNFDDVIVVSANAVTQEASQSSSGTGFTAQGGTASLELRSGGGSVTAAGISILADGDTTFASNVLAGDGRSGTGGTARLSVAAGTLTTDSAVIRADGLGGRAGPVDVSVPLQSGDGFGGTASLVTTGGTTTIASSLALLARGRGGGDTVTFRGQTAPLSGNGTGGNASALLSGGSVSTPSLVLDAQGFGGLGSEDISGGAPDGGNGTGGSAQLVMPGGSAALLTASNVQITANGVGGAAASPDSSSVRGNGGAGTGGSAGFNLADGSFTLGSAIVQADGIGGTGDTGGNGTGGTAAFLLDDSLAGAGPRTIASLSLFGRGLGGASDTGPAATETAGQAQLTANAGSAAGAVSVTGDFLADTTGAIAPAGNGFVAFMGGATFGVGGNSTITTTRDVAMTIGAGGDFATQGTLTITTPRSVTSSGLLSSGSDATVTADLGIAMTDLNSGGATQLTAVAGPVTISNDLSSAGLVTLFGTSVDVSSLGALAFADVDAESGDLAIKTAGSLLVSTIDVVGNVTLTSTAGAAQATGPVNGANVSISAAANATAADITTTGDVSLTSSGGAVQATGAVSGTNITMSAADTIDTVAVNGTGNVSLTSGSTLQAADTISGADVTLTAAGNITTLAVNGTGNVNLASTGGTLQTVGTVTGAGIALSAASDLTTSVIAGSGPVSLTSSGGAVTTTGAVNGGGITLSGADDVQADADVISTAALQVQTGGTFRIGTRAVGTDISAESSDIDIASTGTLGARGTTQSITLRNGNPDSRTFIGGAAQSNGYSLDAAEAARLFADSSIAFGLPGNATSGVGDFIVGDLALSYGASGNIGTGGILKIDTPGRVEVSGAVALTTSSNADRFSIDPTRIDIITDNGGIVMRDSSGALAGQLELVGGTIAIASSAKLAEIANLSTPAAINAALDAPAATPNDAGYVQAGQILFEADSALYIANTGSSVANADRRGFTANGVSIVTGSAATHISINGVLIDSVGKPVTGMDTAQSVVINGAPGTAPGQFVPLSTVNGCIIGQSCQGAETAETTKSDIETPLDPEGSKPEFRYILEIEEREPDDLQPLVDEPVTGVGNDDLWNGTCGSDSGACPQGGNGQ